MSLRDNPLAWSIRIGIWFGTEIQVSWLFPALALLLVFQLGSTYGLTVAVVLTVSILAHEFGHVVAARKTGGQATSILLWPLGGLAQVQAANGLSSRILTILGGPLASLMLCVLTFPSVWYSPFFNEVWIPFQLPLPKELFGRTPLSDIQVLIFWLNWTILVLNLMPILPLDGGRVAQTLMERKTERVWAHLITIRCGQACSILWMLAALYLEWPLVMLMAAFLLVLNTEELMLLLLREQAGESSLSASHPEWYSEEPPERGLHDSSLSLWERWKAKRDAERLQREQEEEEEAELKLDEILAKLHEQGMAALSASEKRLLNRASRQLRERGKSQH